MRAPFVGKQVDGFTCLPRISVLVVLIVLTHTLSVTAQEKRGECVVLLHGLARSHRSMNKMARKLSKQGYDVVNIKYRSRKATVEELAESTLKKAISACRIREATKIHFVTHSLGGILVRFYLEHHDIEDLGRVVMLGPPNQGSEVVDKLSHLRLFRWINGPSGSQLGTGQESVLSNLGPIRFECGVIAGDRSINLFLSRLIPGRDDGKVSIENAKVEGMTDFRVVHATHPLIMRDRKAIKHTLYFLLHGRFIPEEG